jgi:hypothetical protein
MTKMQFRCNYVLHIRLCQLEYMIETGLTHYYPAAFHVAFP